MAEHTSRLPRRVKAGIADTSEKDYGLIDKVDNMTDNVLGQTRSSSRGHDSRGRSTSKVRGDGSGSSQVRDTRDTELGGLARRSTSRQRADSREPPVGGQRGRRSSSRHSSEKGRSRSRIPGKGLLKKMRSLSRRRKSSKSRPELGGLARRSTSRQRGDPQDESLDQEATTEVTKIAKIEERGMSVNQLLDVVKIIEYRCNAEAWKSTNPEKKGAYLQPGDVTLYDLNHYLITPFTKRNNCSYVESIARGLQKPTWFISHWWGESVMDFVHCVRQHAIDHGYSFSNYYYWICAYANNQHDLATCNLESPTKSSFFRAIEVCNRRVLSIMDPNAITFERIWCCLEISMGLNGVYEVYTVPKDGINQGPISKAYDSYICKDLIAKRAQGQDPKELWSAMEETLKNTCQTRYAVGITNGIADIDGDETIRYASMKQFRQSHFPLKPLMKIMGMDVEKSQASMLEDKERILEYIQSEYGTYESFNTKLKGKLISSLWRVFLSNAGGENNINMEEYAKVLLHSNITSMSLSMYGCKQFDDNALKMLADSLPMSLQKFELECDGEQTGIKEGTYLLKQIFEPSNNADRKGGDCQPRHQVLRELILPNCKLTCEFPQEIVHFTQLERVRFEMNGLHGVIPKEIGSCTRLQDFYAFANPKLTGGIPKSIGKLKHLKRFHLGHSKHGGEIPIEFGECTNLEKSYLGNNHFSGPFPPISNMTKLQVLFLNNNNFSGEIPAGIGNCKSLTAIFLHDNHFEGPLPQELSDCDSLRTLSLFGNKNIDTSSFDVLRKCKLTTLYIDEYQKFTLLETMPNFFDLATCVRVISKENSNDEVFKSRLGWDLALTHLPDTFNEF